MPIYIYPILILCICIFVSFFADVVICMKLFSSAKSFEPIYSSPGISDSLFKFYNPILYSSLANSSAVPPAFLCFLSHASCNFFFNHGNKDIINPYSLKNCFYGLKSKGNQVGISKVSNLFTSLPNKGWEYNSRNKNYDESAKFNIDKINAIKSKVEEEQQKLETSINQNKNKGRFEETSEVEIQYDSRIREWPVEWQEGQMVRLLPIYFEDFSYEPSPLLNGFNDQLFFSGDKADEIIDHTILHISSLKTNGKEEYDENIEGDARNLKKVMCLCFINKASNSISKVGVVAELINKKKNAYSMLSRGEGILTHIRTIGRIRLENVSIEHPFVQANIYSIQDKKITSEETFLFCNKIVEEIFRLHASCNELEEEVTNLMGLSFLSSSFKKRKPLQFVVDSCVAHNIYFNTGNNNSNENGGANMESGDVHTENLKLAPVGDANKQAINIREDAQQIKNEIIKEAETEKESQINEMKEKKKTENEENLEIDSTVEEKRTRQMFLQYVAFMSAENHLISEDKSKIAAMDNTEERLAYVKDKLRLKYKHLVGTKKTPPSKLKETLEMITNQAKLNMNKYQPKKDTFEI